MSEENKALECRFIEEVFNESYLATIDEPIDPDWVNQVDPVSPEEARSLEGARQFVEVYHSTIPDMHITVEDQIAEGDKVVTRWTARGTHQGELIDMPPSSDQVTTKVITTDLFSEGKVVETWDSYDVLVMMQLERVMNSAEKPHWDAGSSVSSVLCRSPVFRISKPFLSKFITASR